VSKTSPGVAETPEVEAFAGWAITIVQRCVRSASKAKRTSAGIHDPETRPSFTCARSTYTDSMRLLAAVALVCAVSAQTPQVVRPRMRDGVRLSTNVFLPPTPGPYSTLLVRTPYGKGTGLLPGYGCFWTVISRSWFRMSADVTQARVPSDRRCRKIGMERHIAWISSQPWSTARSECSEDRTWVSRSGVRRCRVSRSCVRSSHRLRVGRVPGPVLFAGRGAEARPPACCG
jgi:hypothetical protein